MKTTQKTFRGSLLLSTLAIGVTCAADVAAEESIGATQAAAQAKTDAAGTRVSWQRIVGIVVPDSIVGRRAPPPDGGCDIGVTCAVGAPAPWSAAGGQAEVNLDNGKIAFTVHGLVVADDFNLVNIGTPT